MLDIKFIRENPDLVKTNCQNRLAEVDIDKLLELDEQRREVIVKIDELRAKRNASSKTKPTPEIIKEMKAVGEEIKALEAKIEPLETDFRELWLRVPNLTHKDVVVSKDEEDNPILEVVKKPSEFRFTPLDHVQLGEKLDVIDFDRATKVSGAKFYYLKNELAILNQALIKYARDFLGKKKYEYIETPLMLNEKSIFASMNKTAIEQSVYSIKDEDLNLIGTAEQSLLAMHSGDVINEWDLPKKYYSYSMCFRKEIGAHGINEKGLWRTHQFNKVEQFIFCKPEDSEKLYDELLKNSEEILKGLELPYRVLEICTGDLADWKFRSADLEVWRPTTKEYGEVMSLSNCTDYQARKLDIKCIDKKGNRRVLHTLNDTAMATSRILVCLLENNQQKDGSIKIPKVLWKYTGFKEIKKKK